MNWQIVQMHFLLTLYPLKFRYYEENIILYPYDRNFAFCL